MQSLLAFIDSIYVSCKLEAAVKIWAEVGSPHLKASMSCVA